MKCPDCEQPITIEQTPLGRWDGSCDNCGWFSDCTYETEEEARNDLTPENQALE